jgi:hypothetical protein
MFTSACPALANSNRENALLSHDGVNSRCDSRETSWNVPKRTCREPSARTSDKAPHRTSGPRGSLRGGGATSSSTTAARRGRCSPSLPRRARPRRCRRARPASGGRRAVGSGRKSRSARRGRAPRRRSRRRRADRHGHSQPDEAPQPHPGGRDGVNRGAESPSFIKIDPFAVAGARRRVSATASSRSRRRSRSARLLVVTRARPNSPTTGAAPATRLDFHPSSIPGVCRGSHETLAHVASGSRHGMGSVLPSCVRQLCSGRKRRSVAPEGAAA